MDQGALWIDSSALVEPTQPLVLPAYGADRRLGCAPLPCDLPTASHLVVAVEIQLKLVVAALVLL